MPDLGSVDTVPDGITGAAFKKVIDEGADGAVADLVRVFEGLRKVALFGVGLEVELIDYIFGASVVNWAIGESKAWKHRDGCQSRCVNLIREHDGQFVEFDAAISG